MRIYYAHCTALYGSAQESRDIALLEHLGAAVLNPNSADIIRRCAQIRECAPVGEDVGGLIMENVFKPLVLDCDLLAFRALPDGRIPAGVAKEIAWAQEAGIPVLELPSGIIDRTMSVASTRNYLHEVGVR